MGLILIILGIIVSFFCGVFCGMLSLAMLIVSVAKDVHGYDLVHHLVRNMPKENKVKLFKYLSADLFMELH